MVSLSICNHGIPGSMKRTRFGVHLIKTVDLILSAPASSDGRQWQISIGSPCLEAVESQICLQPDYLSVGYLL